MTRRLGLATCRDWPALDEDGPALCAAVARAGYEPVVAAWDDPTVAWGDLDAVLIRSTWDYTHRYADFLAWARGIGRTVNDVETLAWSSDKVYLRDLAVAGTPTVPTRYVEPGADPAAALEAAAQTWADVVIKPTVSASAENTGRYALRDSDRGAEPAPDRGAEPAPDRGAAPALDSVAALALAERILRSGRTVMIQPYQQRLDDEGETALIFLGGEFSHAIRKGALLATPGEYLLAHVGEEIDPRTPTPAQVEAARAVLAAVPARLAPPAYARVDLVPGDDGAPTLLELELVEPCLWLTLAPQGVDRAADALVAAALALPHG